jgi:carboxyl-terminal processing protease
MPQRNLLVIFLVVTFSYACYVRTDQNPYARYTSASYRLIDDWALDDVPAEELFAGAVGGMVNVLRRRGDEHSRYITKQNANAFAAEMRQQFGGIGIHIRLAGDPAQLIVVGPPEPGTPAFHADIRPGDTITAIDGKPTAGWDMLKILRHMRGEVGDPVELTLVHPEENQPVTISLVREIITLDSILGDLRNADGDWQFWLTENSRIAYIRIIHFGDKTVGELSKALDELSAEGIDAVVLDLRDNAGGALQAAVATCDMFLERNQEIVETRGRDRQVLDRYVSSGQGKYQDLPIAVLINQNSASASEIVAACLQDNHRATIIGQRSYGKGTVQRVLEVGSRGSSLLKLTSASYWRPDGQNIHRMPGEGEDQAWGVYPDEGYEVPLDEQEYRAFRRYRSKRDFPVNHASAKEVQEAQEGNSGATPFSDRALERAVEHLQSLL